MKTTFKQFKESLETTKKTTSLDRFAGSVENGKFTLDAREAFVENYDLSLTDLDLISLKGCPETVDGSFYCSYNNLSTLAGGPDTVAGDYSCTHNKLKSFEGVAKFIGGVFDGRDNDVVSLQGIEKHITKISGSAFLGSNPIKSHVLGLLKIRGLKSVSFSSSVPGDLKEVQRIMNKYLPMGDMFACQQELIDAGLDEFAKL